MSPTDVLREAQVHAAATVFLRLRPLVVLAGMLAQGAVLSAGHVPLGQRWLIAGVLGSAMTAFTLESFALRHRKVSERWLTVSLALTMMAIASGTSATGGLGSPLATLLLAPLVVAFSALGRRAWPFSVLLVLLLALLAIAPSLGPALPDGVLAASHAVSLVVTAALATLGVVGLGQAHLGVARSLDAMRQGAIDEAAARAREAEALGARVAHELKNPLSAIAALVTLVERSASAARDRERLLVVSGEIQRMERTITDYLTLARPLTDVALGQVALDELLEEVAGVIRGRAEMSNVQVLVHVTPGLTASADRRRLREALVNLAVNAIDALGPQHRGTLTLEGMQKKDAIELAVEDDGPGMAEGVRAHAGEAFFTQREGGTGLGLLVARSVARMHGGDLVLEHPARGLRAVIRLPAESI